MKSILKTFFIVLALVVTAGLGYYLFVYQTSLENTSNATFNNDVATKAARFLKKLNELKEIELNSDILSDGRFSSLTTFTAPVQQEQIGRTNPFDVN